MPSRRARRDRHRERARPGRTPGIADAPAATTQPVRAAIRWLPIAAVAVVTALVYARTLVNGFVDFDDQSNLIENPFFRGLAPSNLSWMFTDVTGHYIPLTWLTFAIDHSLWGMEPAGYHLTNVLLHVANTVVFYGVVLELLRAARRKLPASGIEHVAAAAGAALFALHPLRVESVAWATERRDVLSGLFFLLAIRSYLRFHRHRETEGAAPARGRFPFAALAWYVPSLLAKPVGMTLPLVLLLLDVYPLRRLGSIRDALGRGRAVVIEKLPFVALGLATAIVEGIAESRLDTFYSLEQYGIAGRIGQACYVLAFYVWKTLVPFGLSPLYGLPVGWTLWRADVLIAAAFVVAVSIFLVRGRRRWPGALTAWVGYAVLLAPVLGFAQAGPHLAADRYTYLATLGFAVVVAGTLADLGTRPQAASAYRAALAVTAAVLVVLTMLTWRQIAIWHDSIALWQTAVAADPQCYVCRNNLGNALLRADRPADAAEHFRVALELQPGDADGHANLGNVAERDGRVDDARREYERALAIDPTHPIAHNNLARLLLADGKTDEAIAHLQTALRREPMQGESYINLGLALMNRGDLDGADRELHRAEQILPNAATVPNNLGIVLLRRERPDAALASFRRASELDPSFPEARYNAALALEALGRTQEAIASLHDAVRLRPEYVAARTKLAELLAVTGRSDEAGEQVQAALRTGGDAISGIGVALEMMEHGRRADAIGVLRQVRAAHPDDRDAVNLLAWLLATSPEESLRDGNAALALARSAVEADAEDPDQLDTLAAAYAEVGRFGEAVTTAQRAESLARSGGRDDLAAEIAARVQTYQAGRPYRVE